MAWACSCINLFIFIFTLAKMWILLSKHKTISKNEFGILTKGFFSILMNAVLGTWFITYSITQNEQLQNDPEENFAMYMRLTEYILAMAILEFVSFASMACYFFWISFINVADYDL